MLKDTLISELNTIIHTESVKAQAAVAAKATQTQNQSKINENAKQVQIKEFQEELSRREAYRDFDNQWEISFNNQQITWLKTQIAILSA
jgi:hypothetical protein